MAWYLTRIWIEVTPLRMWWWPDEQDAEPKRWEAARRMGAPVLTSTDADGFVVRTGPLGAAASGQVCLTFRTHTHDMSGQEETPRRSPTVCTCGWIALPDFSVSGGPIQSLRELAGHARVLKPRLEYEAARRGQPVPIPRRPAEPIPRFPTSAAPGGRRNDVGTRWNAF
ncbi:hypothetical protein [Nonomuraea sp. NEAU-A123]|uniref:hypothetical protein n=1 Tax=Nonomuraea sp. NEAU-A123 TaxID=2839649 RepID=UPI001BE3D22D|nr:hypothetical protein [Nonomuraea sp. NEAU-A123]MBT2226078.1 hypothetical protein [Nonomuraea sp. NEAU-A123]